MLPVAYRLLLLATAVSLLRTTVAARGALGEVLAEMTDCGVNNMGNIRSFWCDFVSKGFGGLAGGRGLRVDMSGG